MIPSPSFSAVSFDRFGSETAEFLTEIIPPGLKKVMG
jgi:hypothetical protein